MNIFTRNFLIPRLRSCWFALGNQKAREKCIHHLLRPEGDTAESVCTTADARDGESMERSSRSLEGADGCFLYSLTFEKE